MPAAETLYFAYGSNMGASELREGSGLPSEYVKGLEAIPYST
jgi:hypothetical protein